MTSVAADLAPALDWRQTGVSDHFAQFYDEEAYLLNAVSGFVTEALRSGAAAIVVATREHLDELEPRWEDDGIALEAARQSGRYVALDATETLAQLSVDGWPQAHHFAAVIGSLVARTAARFPRLAVFGEMVALPWREGRVGAAIRLEQLWNELGRQHAFALFCAYPMCGQRSLHGEPFRDVCAAHAHVIPAESYASLRGDTERLAEIAHLQQKARVLEHEIRERTRLEVELRSRVEELATLDRRKDEFLAMLGHELRNPLAPIRNLSELMRRSLDTDPARQRMYQMLERQVEHMTRLLDDLLDVSRITQGKIHLERDSLELPAIVARAIETSRPLIDARRHRLTVSLPEEPVRVAGDLTRLVQMLANLLNNAAKYTPEGGQIAITMRRVGDRVELAVQDSGAGIAPEMLPRVFELFAQSDRTLERAQGGLGIGLTLVRSIVELHGGEVEARSSGAGLGSEFIVRLPIAPAASALSAQGATDGPPGASAIPRRILVVDDNEDAAESLTALLRLAGNEVTIAADGPTALELARAREPDIVLLDIGLPDMDGYEVARSLRARGSTACLIALTGYGQPGDRQRSREAGFDHHLVKPVDLQVLEGLIRD